MPLTLRWVVGFRSAQLQALLALLLVATQSARENKESSLGAREFAPRGRQLEAVECSWNGSVSERSQLRPVRHFRASRGRGVPAR